jgi:pumilio homology domain family member 6
MKKQYILKHMKNAIDAVLEKATFNVGKTPILHRAILDYLTISDPAHCKDMLELLKDHLVHMLHTREGAQVTQYCILHATPKDRKHIVKSFKGFLHSIAKEQYGHAVLITCFECIDDTVLISKALIGELFAPPSQEFTVGTLLRDQYGSRVMLYLLAGRNKKFQPVYLVEELEKTDEIRKETTKKEHGVRHQQLLEATLPLLIQAIAELVPELIRDKNGSTVLLETVHRSTVAVNSILEQVLAQVSDAGDSELESIPEEVVHVVKKMKKEKDTEKLIQQGVDVSESILVNRFGTITLKSLIAKPKDENAITDWKPKFQSDCWKLIKSKSEEYLRHCATSPKGTSGLSFIFVALMENGQDSLVKEIKTSISKGLKKELSSLVEKNVKEPPSDEKKSPKDMKRKRDESFKSGIQIFLSLL